MAGIQLDPEELRPLVRNIVAAVLEEIAARASEFDGKLALKEEEAAELLGLNPWQLRDLRLSGKIGFSRIVGNRVRYTRQDLVDYLARHREEGNWDEADSNVRRQRPDRSSSRK